MGCTIFFQSTIYRFKLPKLISDQIDNLNYTGWSSGTEIKYEFTAWARGSVGAILSLAFQNFRKLNRVFQLQVCLNQLQRKGFCIHLSEVSTLIKLTPGLHFIERNEKFLLSKICSSSKVLFRGYFILKKFPSSKKSQVHFRGGGHVHFGLIPKFLCFFDWKASLSSSVLL